jgi:hypothetical protein
MQCSFVVVVSIMWGFKPFMQKEPTGLEERIQIFGCPFLELQGDLKSLTSTV